MGLPPLLLLPGEQAYRAHYEAQYVRRTVKTFDGIPVRFYADQFEHAFYGRAVHRGPKTALDLARAQRMDWIGWCLGNDSLELYRRRVKGDLRRLVLEPSTPYVVVIEVRAGGTYGVFITAYVADDASTLPKIRSNNRW